MNKYQEYIIEIQNFFENLKKLDTKEIMTNEDVGKEIQSFFESPEKLEIITDILEVNMSRYSDEVEFQFLKRFTLEELRVSFNNENFKDLEKNVKPSMQLWNSSWVGRNKINEINDFNISKFLGTIMVRNGGLESIDSSNLSRYDNLLRNANVLLELIKNTKSPISKLQLLGIGNQSLNTDGIYEDMIKEINKNATIQEQEEVLDVLIEEFQPYEGVDNRTLADSVNFLTKYLESVDINIVEKYSSKIMDCLDKIKQYSNPEADYAWMIYASVQPLNEVLTVISSHNKTKQDELINEYIRFNSKSSDHIYSLVLKARYEQDGFDILKDENIYYIYCLIKTNNLSKVEQEKLEPFIKIFDHITKDIKVPNIEKYSKYINNFSNMDSKLFDEFISDINLYKYSELGIIPEKICDYMISQKLDPNSILNQNLDKYFGTFKKCFEDKAQHHLRTNGINYCYVRVTDELGDNIFGEYRHPKDINGFKLGIYDKESVWFDENDLKNMDENNIRSLNTLFHECKHAINDKDMMKATGIPSPQTYYMFKEEIIGNYDPDFYKENYIYMLNEISARIAGTCGQYEYLKSLGWTDERIIVSDITSEKKRFIEVRDEAVHQELKIEQYADIKKTNNGEYNIVTKIFGDLIKKHPEILKKYPIFALEYFQDGTHKSSMVKLQDYESLINSVGLNDSAIALYNSFFEENQSSMPDDIINDAQLLLEYKTDNAKVKEQRNKIIRKSLLPASKKFKLVNNYLQAFIIQNPDEDISKEILQRLNVIEEPESNKAQDEVQCMSDIYDEVSAHERRGAIQIMGDIKSTTKDEQESSIEPKKYEGPTQE